MNDKTLKECRAYLVKAYGVTIPPHGRKLRQWAAHQESRERFFRRMWEDKRISRRVFIGWGRHIDAVGALRLFAMGQGATLWASLAKRKAEQ